MDSYSGGHPGGVQPQLAAAILTWELSTFAGRHKSIGRLAARGGRSTDYLEHVRTKYKSHIEWFNIDLPWAKRDAMEISVVPK